MNKDELLNIYKLNVKSILSRGPSMLKSMLSFAPPGAGFDMSVDLIPACQLHAKAFRLDCSDAGLDGMSNHNQYINDVTIPLYMNFVLNSVRDESVIQDSLAGSWRTSMLEFIRKTVINMRACFEGYDLSAYKPEISADKRSLITFTSIGNDTLKINLGDFEQLFLHLFENYDQLNTEEFRDSDAFQLCVRFIDAIASSASEKIEITEDDLIKIEKGLTQ